MDVHTKAQRSYNMSRIKSFNTNPEIKIKRFMKLLGFSYQPEVYGRPDYADMKHKITVFIDGCFWHKCPKHYIKPKTNHHFWKDKIIRNIKRDKEVNKKLKKDGWRVVRIWEHDVKFL